MTDLSHPSPFHESPCDCCHIYHHHFSVVVVVVCTHLVVAVVAVDGSGETSRIPREVLLYVALFSVLHYGVWRINMFICLRADISILACHGR